MGIEALKRMLPRMKSEFDVDFDGMKVKMHLLTGAEQACIRHRFENHENGPSADEMTYEMLLYAIHEVDGEPLVAMDLSEEEKDEARALISTMMRVATSYMYSRYIEEEMKVDAKAGAMQLQKLLVDTVSNQLATVVKFPITLPELAEALSRNEDIVAVAADLSALEGKYVEASSMPVVRSAEQDESEEPVTTLGVEDGVATLRTMAENAGIIPRMRMEALSEEDEQMAMLAQRAASMAAEQRVGASVVDMDIPSSEIGDEEAVPAERGYKVVENTPPKPVGKEAELAGKLRNSKGR